MLQNFVEAIVAFVRDNEGLVMPTIFLVAFGESFCFFSLFWPGTAILAGLIALLAASGADIAILTPAIVAASAGGAVGYSLSYWIGLYFKDSLHNVWPFATRPHLIPQSQRFFQKYGAFSVFLGHFFGPVRAVIPIVAGMFAMRQIPFQIANIAASIIWAAWVIALPFLLVMFKDDVFAFMRDNEALIVILMFLLALGASIPHTLIFVAPALLVVVVGALHLFAGGNFWPLWLAAAAGAFAGDIAAYRMGQHYNEDVFDTWLMSGDGETIARVRAFVDRKGTASIVLSKFLWIWRAWVPVVAGTMAMPFRDFTIASAISAFLWAAVFLSPRIILGLFGW